MSDMASGRITFRIPQTLGQRLRQRSRIQGKTESVLVREALESYLAAAPGQQPAYDLAEQAGLIGVIPRGRRAPARDLSTNRGHFEGFGKPRSSAKP
jgi:predicted DNA-binding protein